jgi:predicted AAA+ superfamily ATPase
LRHRCPPNLGNSSHQFCIYLVTFLSRSTDDVKNRQVHHPRFSGHEKAFDDFWETGGFPEVAGLDRRLRIKIHQEYFNTVLFRDLIERYDVSHPVAVKDLAHRLIENTATLYSVNRLTSYLQSLGHKAPKSAVSDYLDWFEDAYFLFTVQIFDASVARRKINPKKIYCIDHSLVTSVAPGILVNSGHLLENLVFTALRRVSPEIYYCRTSSGMEVDFVARPSDGPRLLVQVCESLSDPRTRKRELAALGEAMTELGLDEATLVTRGETEEIDVGAGTIRVVPAWRFLIDLPEP